MTGQARRDLIVAASSAVCCATFVAVTSALLGLPHIWPGTLIGLELNFVTVLWFQPWLRSRLARRGRR